MDTSEEAELAANAIFRCDKTDELLCSICIRSDMGSLSKHLEKPQHSLKLARFDAAFVPSDSGITCKTCKSEVKWTEVKMHAISHKIVPWHQPQDKFETLFKNHTFRLKRMFYCYLCDRVFPVWYLAWIHLDEEAHASAKKGVPCEIPENISQHTYRDWMANGFVPLGQNDIECTICDATLDVELVDVHCKVGSHLKNKLKFGCRLTQRVKREGLLDDNEESGESEKISGKKSKAKAPKPKIIAAPIPRPMICNFLLEPEVSSFNGMSSDDEAAPDENDEPEDAWYSVNFPKIDSKCRGSPKISTRAAEQPESPQSREVFNTTVDYVVDKSHPFFETAIGRMKPTRSKPDSYCIICVLSFAKVDTFNHLTGKRHKQSLKKYGCDNIKESQNAAYYCNCCDRRIDALSKLAKHLGSEEHSRMLKRKKVAHNNEVSSSLDAEKIVDEHEETKENGVEMPIPEDSALPCQYSTPSDENSTPSGQAAPTSPETKACLYIIKQNAKKSLCQICDINELPIATKKIIEHTQSQRHIIALKRYGCDKIVASEDGNYRCTCCKLDIQDVKKVFLHIKDKKHTSSLIKVKEESRQRTKIVNRTFSPESIYRTPTRNCLSDYIANINSNMTNGDNLGSSETRFDQDDAKQPELRSILTSMASEVSRLCKHIEENKRLRQLAKNFGNETDPKHQDETAKAKWVEAVVCPICSCDVLDLTKLHSHMATHFQDDFVARKVSINRADSIERETAIVDHEGSSETICNGRVNGHANSVDEIVCNGKSTPFDSPKSGRSVNSPIDSPKSFGSLNSLADLETLFQSENSIPDSMSRAGPRDIANNAERDNFPLSHDTMEKLFKKKAAQPAKNTPRKMNMKKVAEALNFDTDTIYDLRDKLSEMEFGFKLSLVIDAKTIYCLICRKTLSNTLQDYYDHLWSVLHCQNLETMEHDDSLFEDSPDQFSDLKLAQEYMEEISQDHVHCFICNKDVMNNDEALREHIYEKNHERTCETMISNAAINFNGIKSRLKCDWYSVQNYWCVPCFRAMRNEVSFAKHLDCRGHRSKLRNRENRNKKMILDYCSTCSLLLCGYRATYAHHTEIAVHKWLERDGYYIIRDLPGLAKILLAEPDKYVVERIERLDEISTLEAAKEERLLRDLKEIVSKRFPRVKAYTFGSRVSGLGSEESDIDIYLDCRNTYDGKNSSLSHVIYFITGIHLCLTNHPECWDVNELLINCRAPIIRAYHRATGLACDISVEHGLSVENTKLIRSFNTNYPPCRKLMLILKQWLAYCDLSGSDRITSYALCWLVIFYLQTESILPSIATLVKMKSKSRIVGGWETGVATKFACWESEVSLSIKELLKRFFAFYADFDYRYDVACPLLGEIIKKQDFVDPSELPEEMRLYVLYTKSSKDAEPFRIDSAMCIQDPFDLRHNLTKAVGKVYLNRFRVYCSRSFDVLSSF